MPDLGRDHRHAFMACPHCGYRMDAATGIDHDREPEDGSVGLCLACAGIMRYTKVLDTLTLALFPKDEEDTIAGDLTVAAGRQAILLLRATRGPLPSQGGTA